MRTLVTGVLGYVGSHLTEYLTRYSHEVTGYDIGLFGGERSGDIRDLTALDEALKGQEAVIHLASISSDAACQKNEALAKAINVTAFEPLVIAAKLAGVKKFIFLSSSAVYGSTDVPATETHPLRPTTIYSRHKAMCEPILLKHSKDMICTILRPGAVFGWAPRMRFDTTVNMMTNHAVNKKIITVNGGAQLRPVVHIDDLVSLIQLCLEREVRGIFNVALVSLPVREIARLVSNETGVTIHVHPHTDNRSYQMDCGKLRDELGFTAQSTIQDGVQRMVKSWRYGQWQDSMTNPVYMNIPDMDEN